MLQNIKCQVFVGTVVFKLENGTYWFTYFITWLIGLLFAWTKRMLGLGIKNLHTLKKALLGKWN